jgi:hypothetical protein
MARAKMRIPSSSDENSSDDEGEGKPSVDDLAEAAKFFQNVCTKQKARLKTLKNKLISSQNDYKGLCHTLFWKANRMRTMYVPGSETHVHSDYIIRHHHTMLEINSGKVL